MRDSLAGLRVLVVEDEAMVALLLEEYIEEIGCTVVGPVAQVDPALAKLAESLVDAAVLDVNLQGSWSYPIADALAARGLPFLFITGYGKAGLDPAYRDRPLMQKPFTQDGLEAALKRLVCG